MKRNLKTLIDRHEELTYKWYEMTVHNSTDEERKDAWNEIVLCRLNIARTCADILGIRNYDQAKAIAASLDRSTLCKILSK